MATAINLLSLLLLIEPYCNIWYEYNGNGYCYVHYVKVPKCGVFSGPYFPVLGLTTGKYGPEKLRISTLFTQ